MGAIGNSNLCFIRWKRLGIHRIPGRQRATERLWITEERREVPTVCVCVFYHHTSWPISHQHPLSHIFRDSAAAFSKHKRKRAEKKKNPDCWLCVQFHSKHNCRTTEPGEHTSPLPPTPWLCLISLSLSELEQSWWKCLPGAVSTSHVGTGADLDAWEKKLLDKHWRDCSRRRFRGLKHFSKLSQLLLLLLLLLWWCYCISWALLIILCSTLGFFIQWKCNIRKKNIYIYIIFIFSKHSKQISVEINATVWHQTWPTLSVVAVKFDPTVALTPQKQKEKPVHTAKIICTYWFHAV